MAYIRQWRSMWTSIPLGNIQRCQTMRCPKLDPCTAHHMLHEKGHPDRMAFFVVPDTAPRYQQLATPPFPVTPRWPAWSSDSVPHLVSRAACAPLGAAVTEYVLSVGPTRA